MNVLSTSNGGGTRERECSPWLCCAVLVLIYRNEVETEALTFPLLATTASRRCCRRRRRCCRLLLGCPRGVREDGCAVDADIIKVRLIQEVLLALSGEKTVEPDVAKDLRQLPLSVKCKP